MLNLKLRDEFLGTHTPGTMISLRDEGRGAAEIGPEYILSITYPTADVQTALRNVSKARASKPIVLMGDRGRGKSHIMAVIHHALASPEAVEKWAHEWAKATDAAALADLELESAYFPISEPVHNQEYQLLWDLLFDRHPKGDYYRGKFEEQGHPYPPRSLLIKMFDEQPTALILDEFQKWFDGLSDQPGAEGVKYRTWAENFIQNLSEIAKDRPDILILVTSVLNNGTEAFRQVHRVGPVLVDFSGPTAKEDRQRLVLHRLFKNRTNIPDPDIGDLVAAYASERFRLRFSHESGSEKAKRCQEVVECFPFSPELLDLLDSQILMAAAAQEARDLIRILAFVFRARGDAVPLITPADFFVDDDACGVQSLLDSIATAGEQERLREVAQRNLDTVNAAVGPQVPNARELISALWMRSMSPGRNPGGTRQELHLDITRAATVDGNAFQAELVVLVENSINIHGEQTPDGRLHFALEENPRSKVRATARNPKIWTEQASAAMTGQPVYPGQDIDHLRNTIRAMLVTDTQQDVSRVVVLGPKWQNDPWSEVDDGDKPASWDRPILLAFPEAPTVSPTGHVPGLGEWLAKHVPSRRNTIRYLFPSGGSATLFSDDDLVFVARCSFLCGIAWRDDVKYRMLKDEFDRALRADLKKRFDRFLVLRHWDFQETDQCAFDVERISEQGAKIPNAVEQKILRDLFDPQDFAHVLADRAKENFLVGDILDELLEPPSDTSKDAMPFLGELQTFEQILALAASGQIVINREGTWIGRLPEHDSGETALRYIRSKAFCTGQAMRKLQLGLPSAVGGGAVPGPTPKPPPTSGGTTTVTPTPGTGTGTPTPGTGGTPYPGGPGLPFPPVAEDHTVTKTTPEPASGINLVGSFEKWGVASSTTLNKARVEFSDLTVQQMKQVLQRLPSSVKALLEVTFDEEDGA
jgi:hypothetical protein